MFRIGVSAAAESVALALQSKASRGPAVRSRRFRRIPSKSSAPMARPPARGKGRTAEALTPTRTSSTKAPQPVAFRHLFHFLPAPLRLRERPWRAAGRTDARRANDLSGRAAPRGPNALRRGRRADRAPARLAYAFQNASMRTGLPRDPHARRRAMRRRSRGRGRHPLFRRVNRLSHGVGDDDLDEGERLSPGIARRPGWGHCRDRRRGTYS